MPSTINGNFFLSWTHFPSMSNPPPRTFLPFSLFLLCLLSSFPLSEQKTLTFEFSSFALRNLTLLSDSYLRNGAVALASDLGLPSSSSGSVVCNSPIRFFNPRTNSSASFNAKFIFSINNVDPSSFGNGLTFFISSSNQTLGSPGKCLGFFSSSNVKTIKKIVAVELSNPSDSKFEPANLNHVGLDLGSCKSINKTNIGSRGYGYKSGTLITTWMNYFNSRSKVVVRLSYSDFKPKEPLLSVKVDLSRYFEEFMYIGFSVSKEESAELHRTIDWRLKTFGISYFDPPSSFPPQLYNVSDSSWSVIPVIPLLPTLNSPHKSHRKLVLGLGITGPLVLFIILGWHSTMKWNEIRTQRGIKSEILTGPRRFSFKEIKSTTRGFHSSRIVGHGAFGTVYKAFLPESDLAFAVKRSKHTHQGKSDFMGELTIISRLRHKNLLQLQGWCIEKGEVLLVYEFMPKGSLDKVLHAQSETMLTWTERYNIAVGIASALTYLHQECEQQVIHRDVKTSNILLDGKFNPKLGDFGMARFMDPDKSSLATLTAGTMGYLAPDYLQHGRATEKTDVYSYGVVILEVASGKKPIDEDANSERIVNLVDWVWELYSKGRFLEAVDPKLSGDFEEEEVRRLLLLGLSCAHPDCTARPSMRKVLQILRHEAELPVSLKKPNFTSSSELRATLEELISECEDSFLSSPLYEIKLN